MVQLLSALAGLAILLTTASASPLVIPLGNTGRSLSISEDGESIAIDGESINLSQAARAVPACNSGGSKKKGNKGKGKNKGSSSSAAANATADATAGAKAIYFVTNAAKNSVVALKVAADGTLSDGSITATGGAGSSGILLSNNETAAPDAMFSQGAVKVAGNNLVAVNPGSNTISMFAIDATDPTKLTMVGKPADTLGDFPMSVSLSAKLGQACVANSGTRAGVACFSMDATKGLTALDKAQRPFDIGQSNPPKGPEGTVSQTFFNADSTVLFTTVKGNPAIAGDVGFLSAFPVVNGVVSTKETRSSPNGTAVLFGTANIPGSSDIFVTDASFGSATLSLDANNVATISAQTKIADQAATCWATISDITKTAFVTDVGVNHLVEVDTASGNLIKELNSTNGNPGLIDLVSAGNFIYALSPGNCTVKAAVTVFDISGGSGSAKEIQNFNPTGVSDSAQGMAFI